MLKSEKEAHYSDLLGNARKEKKSKIGNLILELLL